MFQLAMLNLDFEEEFSVDWMHFRSLKNGELLNSVCALYWWLTKKKKISGVNFLSLEGMASV